ncbi:MAG: hypothetical protein LBR39_02195 [Coriobacteriales bacterium]|jgi:hypothetical protein|nr:hypothetical protein [Coriobacteriales bacterium]
MDEGFDDGYGMDGGLDGGFDSGLDAELDAGSDLLDEAGDESIDFSDPAVADELMLDDTGQTEISEMPEDEEVYDVPDTDEATDVEPILDQGANDFGYNGTCGPTSAANTLNDLLGSNEFSENDILEEAINSELCTTTEQLESMSQVEVEQVFGKDATDVTTEDIQGALGGTTTDQMLELYDNLNDKYDLGISTEVHEFDDALSIEQMADKLDEGDTVQVAVDFAQLDPSLAENADNGLMNPTGEVYTDHWITVTGTERDETGAITGFDVVDSSGTGIEHLSAEQLEAASLGSEGREVLDPTAIVVSKAA